MALRGTLTHRKTRRLAKLLNVSPCFALGIVEALWHVTAEQCPAGDIGRLSNLDIAEELFYEGDADALIDSLISSGFLDNHAGVRLVVHDWQEHADQSVKRKLARHGKEFSGHDESCLVMPSTPEPESSIQSPEPESSKPPKPPEGESGEEEIPKEAYFIETYLPPEKKTPEVVEACRKYREMRTRKKKGRWLPETCRARAEELAKMAPATIVECLDWNRTQEYTGLITEKFLRPPRGSPQQGKTLDQIAAGMREGSIFGT